MKLISLKERSPKTGRFEKNETFTLYELKNFVYNKNRDFFSHWLFGMARQRVLDIIFSTFSVIIDLDIEGNHKIER
jgi:hypothetical protein